jgi:hypothetical protein
MSDQPKPDQFALRPELAALQARLGQFAPSAPRVDRDRLMFEAGRAAEKTRSRELGAGSRIDSGVCATGSASAGFWRAVAATTTAATVLLSATLAWQNRPAPVAPQTAPSPPVAAAPTNDVSVGSVFSLSRPSALSAGYLGARDAALAGRESDLALEGRSDRRATSSPTTPTNSRQLLEQLLPATSRQRS